MFSTEGSDLAYLKFQMDMSAKTYRAGNRLGGSSGGRDLGKGCTKRWQSTGIAHVYAGFGISIKIYQGFGFPV